MSETDAGEEAELTRRQLVLVAESLDARLPEIVRDMRDLLVASIGELGGDPQLVEMLQASIEGNVSTICHILANDIDIDNLQPTTAAAEYAIRLAQRDVPVSALTRAYYLGQSMFLRLGIDAVEELSAGEEQRISLVRVVAETVHRYIDWILQYVAGVYEAERRAWWNARATRNGAVIARVLRGEDRAIASFEHDTGYRLGGTHLAAVAWIEGHGQPSDQHQAQAARAVATASRPHVARRVVGYTDDGVSLLAMFVADLAATRRYAAEVLGDAAAPGEREDALRATLESYDAGGGNVMRTAEELGVHRNTVRQRVTRFEAGCAGPIDRVELTLALCLYAAFG